jgi:adenylate kinase
MIAAPGGGKGTQGKRLAAMFSVQHVCSGEVLRAEARVDAPVGRELAAYQERHAADAHKLRVA